MRISQHFGLLFAVAAGLGVSACNTDLAITDPNAPNTERAVSNSDDVAALIGGSVSYWHGYAQETEPGDALAVMADAMTSSFGNFGMRFNSNEPRIAYNNTASSGDAVVAYNPWRRMYAALGQADDGLAAIGRGVKITDANGNDITDEFQAIGRFIQGSSLGFIGLLFDKGFIVDETTTLPAPATFSPYKDVSTAALAQLDKAIALSTGKTWVISKDYMTDINMTAPKFAMLANTMAARILAYTPRTAAENAAVDWSRVGAYARKGINYDYAPIGDGGNNWWDNYKGYLERQSWARVDMRVIHEIDPTQPAEITSCTTLPPQATSADARLGTDIKYYPSIPFQEVRGCYHFSPWAHVRYFDSSWDSPNKWTTPMPMILKAENDLLLAEADVRTAGDLNEAATLINNSRVGRGHLPPVTAATGAAGLLQAIQYEQDVELLMSGAGIQFFDRRRINGLQPQTPLHLPVPAAELQTDGLPVYTFGGPDHPDH